MGKRPRRKGPPQHHRPPQPRQPSDPGESTVSENADISAAKSVAAAAAGAPAAAESEDAALDDGKSEVDEPIECRHLRRGLNLEKLEKKLTSFAAAALVCPTCTAAGRRHPKVAVGKKKKPKQVKKSPEISALWICLACGNIGCEESDGPVRSKKVFGNGHAVEHCRQQRHPLALKCGDRVSIWCFECKSTIAGAADFFYVGDPPGPKASSLKQAVQIIQDSYFQRKNKQSAAGNRNADGDVAEENGEIDQKNVPVRGLQNLGNTCFFNSVMQNLSAVRRLRDHFLRPLTAEDGSLTTSEGPLTSALRKFYVEFNAVESADQQPQQQQHKKGKWKEKGCYNPKGLLGAVCSHAPRFSGSQQQDSHELLRCLLDGLQLEEERVLRKEGNGRSVDAAVRGDTVVQKLFGGELSSTLCCSECGHSSSVSEPFLDLSLPLPVPEGGEGRHSPSKRELKGKKKVWEGRSQGPAVKLKPSSSVQSSDGAGKSVLDDVSWLSYVGDDFVDVSLAEPEEQLLQATDTSAATRGSSQASETSVTTPMPDADTSPTVTTDSSSAAALVHASSTAETDTAQTSSTTDTSAASGASARQISSEELEKVLGELLPLKIPPSPAIQEGWEGVAESEVTVVGGAEDGVIPLPSSGEVDEALCSAPAVIALPYWEDHASGWEVVASTGDSDGSGLAGLFHEEDVETGVVLGCANRDGAGPSLVGEEPEEIIERTISPMTLEGCLLAFTQPEVLTGDNAWECEGCLRREAERADEEPSSAVDDEGGTSDGPRDAAGDNSQVRRNATKKLAIKQAPPVLTVHLKRFGQDVRGRLSKLTGHVAFEEVLDLGQFLSSRDSSGVYRLVGVVEHSGTLKGGHYVAFVRVEAPGSASGFWYYISDSNVRRATLEEVLGCEAYLLFYERV